jgi:hypothetical protein
MPNAKPDATPEEQPKLQLSAVQVTAAVLASITSAVILSKFGVAGTYVGTAVGSAVSTIGVAVYAHTMRQARRRVERYAHLHHADPSQVRPVGTTVPGAPPVRTPPGAWSYRHPRTAPPVPVRASPPPRSGWRARLDQAQVWFADLPLAGKAVVTAAGAFLLAVMAVVLFQFLSGHSLTNVWGIGSSSNGPSAGCVIGRCGGTAPTSPHTQDTPTATAPPTTEPTPTATPAPTPTATPTPVASPTPSTVASPATGASPATQAQAPSTP